MACKFIHRKFYITHMISSSPSMVVSCSSITMSPLFSSLNTALFSGSFWQHASKTITRFEVFTELMIHIVVSLVMIPCGLLDGYQCFKGTYFPHLQDRSQSEDEDNTFLQTILTINIIIWKTTIWISVERSFTATAIVSS